MTKMTSSQEQYRESIGRSEPIPVRLRAYYKQRFQQKAFARLAKAFAERAEEFDLTKSGIAVLVDRDKAQINRLFAHPSNMTLDTYSELALALNFEPTLLLEDLNEDPRHNYSHPAYSQRDKVVDSMQSKKLRAKATSEVLDTGLTKTTGEATVTVLEKFLK